MPDDSVPVYTGTNRIIINEATMKVIIENWLHETHDGGPYTVNKVVEEAGPYQARDFEITFTDAPKPQEK